ncbi:MAG: hypothetical protein GF383_15730, partial [Candidatus Lokiarchaeota archaeon]|nr:hypothetical protein [Candidatus Lokiarchaeota archaeon]MBD3343037.1 hypothetical protein [Candidatus Lokiarchaeota archaeon]
MNVRNSLKTQYKEININDYVNIIVIEMEKINIDELLKILPKLIRENDTVKGAIISALSGVVATHEDVIQLTRAMNERFQKVDERFEAMQRTMEERFQKVDERFEAMQRTMEERFQKV